MNLKSITFICLLFVCYSLFGQTKQEQEFRIKQSSLPEVMVSFIEKLPKNTKKVRFYKEIDGDQQSFEIKFRLNRTFYSAEFTTKGNLEDIEVITKTKHVDNTILKTITSYFDANFKKTKLLKIQKQYFPNPNQTAIGLLNTILVQNTNEKPRYEIIAEVTDSISRNLREFNFKEDGTFIKSRIVAPSSYGHVLY